jgi:predicted transcriptional regulator
MYMNAALDDVAFLALSENRIALLEALSDERTHSRDDLMDDADVSRPTLARILDDRESRAWITQHGQECRITLLGAWVHEEFIELLGTMDAARKLREVIRWLPTDDVDFDVVRRLDEAEFVFATESDPTAPIRRAGEQLRTGTRLRFLTTQVTLSYFDAVRESVAHSEMTVRGVVTPGVYDALQDDPTMAAAYRDLHESGNAAFFVADDSPPILQIVDDSVGLGLVDGAENPQGLILSDDEAVLSWAEETFESYRETASRVTPDGLPEE